jgi:hypothetical protein
VAGIANLFQRLEISNRFSNVMPALVAGIHVFLAAFNRQKECGQDEPALLRSDA